MNLARLAWPSESKSGATIRGVRGKAGEAAAVAGEPAEHVEEGEGLQAFWVAEAAVPLPPLLRAAGGVGRTAVLDCAMVVFRWWWWLMWVGVRRDWVSKLQAVGDRLLVCALFFSRFFGLSLCLK